MSEPLVSDLPQTRDGDEKLLPIAVYILYILGWASIGLTPLIGFVMAYALKARAPDWVRTHYVFAIRTAWLGLIGWVAVALIYVLGAPLLLVMVGFLLWYVAAGLAGLIGVWVTVRCIAGLIYASRCEPYPRPSAWIV